MAEHTPGPWMIDPKYLSEIQTADDRTICSASKAVTAHEVNAAFDPADEALGGAFKDGFREGWLMASDCGPDREELEEDYSRSVDMAPTECWEAYRAKYFAMLPLAAIPSKA